MGGHIDVSGDVFHGQALSLFVVSSVDAVTYFLQVGFGVGIDVVVGTSGPECVFVDLDGVTCHTSVDHRSEATVAERKGLKPVIGRAVITQSQIVLSHKRDSRHGHHHVHKKFFHSV